MAGSTKVGGVHFDVTANLDKLVRNMDEAMGIVEKKSRAIEKAATVKIGKGGFTAEEEKQIKLADQLQKARMRNFADEVRNRTRAEEDEQRAAEKKEAAIVRQLQKLAQEKKKLAGGKDSEEFSEEIGNALGKSLALAGGFLRPLLGMAAAGAGLSKVHKDSIELADSQTLLAAGAGVAGKSFSQADKDARALHDTLSKLTPTSIADANAMMGLGLQMGITTKRINEFATAAASTAQVKGLDQRGIFENFVSLATAGTGSIPGVVAPPGTLPGKIIEDGLRQGKMFEQGARESMKMPHENLRQKYEDSKGLFYRGWQKAVVGAADAVSAVTTIYNDPSSVFELINQSMPGFMQSSGFRTRHGLGVGPGGLRYGIGPIGTSDDSSPRTFDEYSKMSESISRGRQSMYGIDGEGWSNRRGMPSLRPGVSDDEQNEREQSRATEKFIQAIDKMSDGIESFLNRLMMRNSMQVTPSGKQQSGGAFN